MILDAAMGYASGRGCPRFWFWSGLYKVTKSIFVLEAAFVTIYRRRSAPEPGRQA